MWSSMGVLLSLRPAVVGFRVCPESNISSQDFPPDWSLFGNNLRPMSRVPLTPIAWFSLAKFLGCFEIITSSHRVLHPITFRIDNATRLQDPEYNPHEGRLYSSRFRVNQAQVSNW